MLGASAAGITAKDWSCRWSQPLERLPHQATPGPQTRRPDLLHHCGGLCADTSTSSAASDSVGLDRNRMAHYVEKPLGAAARGNGQLSVPDFDG